jgi:hypothetical protein
MLKGRIPVPQDLIPRPCVPDRLKGLLYWSLGTGSSEESGLYEATPQKYSKKAQIHVIIKILSKAKIFPSVLYLLRLLLLYIFLNLLWDFHPVHNRAPYSLFVPFLT